MTDPGVRSLVAQALRDLASWALAHTPQEIHEEALYRARVVEGSEPAPEVAGG